LGVRNGFVAIGGELLAIAELKKKVLNCGGGIPLSCHGRVIGSEILGADGPVFVLEVLEELKGSAKTKFGDGVFERCKVFVRAAVDNHGDKNDFEFTEGFVVLA
jgi:hypothetical protein